MCVSAFIFFRSLCVSEIEDVVDSHVIWWRVEKRRQLNMNSEKFARGESEIEEEGGGGGRRKVTCKTDGKNMEPLCWGQL